MLRLIRVGQTSQRLFSTAGAVAPLSADERFAHALLNTGSMEPAREPVHVSPNRPGLPRTGSGGRASDAGQVITIFGATGFLGKYVVNLLGNTGHTCIIPFRGDDMEVRNLRLAGDYGRINPLPYSTKDDDSMREAIKRSDIVINLISKHYETTHVMPWMKNATFHDVNVRIPRRIAEMCREENVQRLIHVSALAANESSDSMWARTKYDGETAVRMAFPDATIVKPAMLFGSEDRFLNSMAQMYFRIPGGKMILPEGGKAKVQPVFVGDVAQAVVNAIPRWGETFHLAGPEQTTYHELGAKVSGMIRHPFKVRDVPAFVAQGMGAFMDIFPNPPTSKDEVTMRMEDNILDADAGHSTLADLDVKATPIDDIAFSYLHRYRQGGHFPDML